MTPLEIDGAFWGVIWKTHPDVVTAFKLTIFFQGNILSLYLSYTLEIPVPAPRPVPHKQQLQPRSAGEALPRQTDPGTERYMQLRTLPERGQEPA